MCQEWAEESVPVQRPKTARARVGDGPSAAEYDAMSPRSRERERIRVTTPAATPRGPPQPLPKETPPQPPVPRPIADESPFKNVP